MARGADFVIVTDSERGVTGTEPLRIGFEIPDSVELTVSRAIIGFMAAVENRSVLDVRMQLNGTVVWALHEATTARHPVRYFQEVIQGSNIRAGANVFEVAGTSSQPWSVRFSDVVVWFRKNL